MGLDQRRDDRLTPRDAELTGLVRQADCLLDAMTIGAAGTGDFDVIATLDDAARGEALAELGDWTYDPDRKALFREIVRPGFAEAFGLMTAIAIEAEKADHHPEWSNVYNRISIWLTTHDAGGVSARDVALARRIDSLAGR